MKTTRLLTEEAGYPQAVNGKPGAPSRPLAQSLLDASDAFERAGMSLDRLSGRLLRASLSRSFERSETDSGT